MSRTDTPPQETRVGEPPRVQPRIEAQVGPGRAAPHDTLRVRTAAAVATRLHPGPIGELLARELHAHASLGHLTVGDSLLPRLVDQLLHPAQDPR